MSEFQYYEFQAIDRPLTAEEMHALRAFSSRARITPRSFINHYNWGDLKANPDELMDQYFDAFLYVANWGTRLLELRLPERLLDLATTMEYCGDTTFTARQSGDNVILSFSTENEGDDQWIEPEGPDLRPEANGDAR